MTEAFPPDNLDLPALRTPATEDLLDLPMPLLESGPRRLNAAPADYPAWSTIANQRHIRGLARDALTNDLWLATSGGVLHWASDMQTFTRYGSEHGLVGHHISAIAIDGQHRCWVAYEQGGIGYFADLTWRPYALLPDVKATCLRTDSAGHLWVASTQGIFLLGDAEHLPLLEIPYAGDAPRALAISQGDAHSKQLWLCNARGVFRIEIHYWGDFATDVMDVAGEWIHCVAQPGILTLVSAGNGLWLGTTAGLALLNPATGNITQSELWPRGEVTALAPCQRGVWVASAGKIGQATPATWKAFGKANPAQHLERRATAIAPLDAETAWLGTHDGLLCVTPTDTRHHLTEEPPDVIGLTTRTGLSNMIQALAVQQQQQKTVVWIGTANSLFCLDTTTNSWRRYEQRDIRALVTLPDQSKVAMLSWLGGTYTLDGQKATRVLSTELSGSPVALTLNADGAWWVAGLHGLYHRQRDAADWSEKVRVGEQLPRGAWIRSLSQVSPTQLWLGTAQGLFIYDIVSTVLQPVLNIAGDTDILALLTFSSQQADYCCIGTRRGPYIGNVHDARSIQHVSSLAYHTVTALLHDQQQDMLWVGTTKGLFALRQQQGEWTIGGEWHCQNSGLAANRITALALSATEQNEQCLWIGTPCGLSRFTY